MSNTGWMKRGLMSFLVWQQAKWRVKDVMKVLVTPSQTFSLEANVASILLHESFQFCGLPQGTLLPFPFGKASHIPKTAVPMRYLSLSTGNLSNRAASSSPVFTTMRSCNSRNSFSVSSALSRSLSPRKEPG